LIDGGEHTHEIGRLATNVYLTVTLRDGVDGAQDPGRTLSRLAATVARVLARMREFDLPVVRTKASSRGPSRFSIAWYASCVRGALCHTLLPVAASTTVRGTLMVRERSHSPSAFACESSLSVEVAPVPSSPRTMKLTAPRLGSS
jgi:hypothetical protein